LLLYFSGGYATCPNPIDISSAELDPQFTAYFDYASGLCSDNKPDYSHLRKIFNDLFICQGFEKDNNFDWYGKKYQKLAKGKARAESRPLSQHWLKEVKDIYANVLKAEQESIEAQTKFRAHVKPGQVQWEDLLRPHLSLMTECTDLFEATQHPSAGSDLHKLQLERIRATTMWHHGIFTPLRLLTRSNHSPWFRPIWLMVLSLYEMVPEFETTWIEYLWFLADYKMSTEDAGTRCREIWGNKSRYWDSRRDPSAKGFLQTNFTPAELPKLH
jgi:hypothetical protein